LVTGPGTTEAVAVPTPRALASLILDITLINAWNGLNVATRQVPGVCETHPPNRRPGSSVIMVG
jgi:hypothetical protein